MAPRLFVYKLTSDTGAAPCVHDGLLTLAICKPMIRSLAQVGDLLFGFAADSLSPDNRLIYIARVTAIEDEYYDAPDYVGSPDRIYRRGEDGRFRIRSDARYHEDGAGIERDIGAFPEYHRARVLVSDDFRYFGSSGRPTVDLSGYSTVVALVRGLEQGHRVKPPARSGARALAATASGVGAKLSGPGGRAVRRGQAPCAGGSEMLSRHRPALVTSRYARRAFPFRGTAPPLTSGVPRRDAPAIERLRATFQ